MGEYTQDNRFIQVFTPLGVDTLLLKGFHGQEGVSRLFNFELRMYSEKMGLTFNDIVGKTTTIKMLLPNKRVRYINGIVSSFAQGGTWVLEDGRHPKILASYTATLVPCLWVLTQTGDCRIFQNKSVPEILSDIFKEHGFSNFEFRLKPGDYEKREYCVQYRETDFNFVSRLMEEEGIFYFFEHQEQKHILVLADNNKDFKPSPLLPLISYNSTTAQEGDGEIREWSASQEVRPGKYTVTDYNFIQPSLDLTYSVNGYDVRNLEVFDFPGEFTGKEQGKRLAAIRIEEEQALMEAAKGTSSCGGLAAGYRFELLDHYRPDFNRSYVPISVYHSAEQGMNYRSTSGGAAADFIYSNQFQCIRHDTPYRPPRVTPVPIVHGTQTAIVVGRENDEIYVDEYGRVRVQFHWDRHGKYNEESSCWVRVSQNLAGKRFGSMFIPRVGQEVIVSFLEGDPDKPIITGRVYNGESMPPYKLPDHMTMSTIKTHSSKGGGGFNEIRFEDLKGREQLFFHAERDHDVRVKHDKIEWVGNESHLIVKKDRLEKVEGDKHLQVTGDQNEKVDGTVSLNAGKELLQKVGMKAALDAGTEIHLKAGVNLVIEAGNTLTFKVGGNFINLNPTGVFIQGTMVMINSGGAAGAGSGASPEAPKEPREADKAEPGAKPEMPPPKTPVKPKIYDSGVLALKQAAMSGLPFTATGTAGAPLPQTPDPTVQLPAGAITEERANELFKDLADRKETIPFDYPIDCCYSRAHEMCRIMKEKGVKCGKVWNYGHNFPRAGLKADTKNVPWDYVEWTYHVAPTVKVHSGGGKTKDMVMDPSLFDKPVTVDEWKKSMKDDRSKIEMSDDKPYFRTPGDTYVEKDEDGAKTKEMLEQHVESRKDLRKGFESLDREKERIKNESIRALGEAKERIKNEVFRDLSRRYR
jgi:type VI secretion system secreted protein VgrG